VVVVAVFTAPVFLYSLVSRRLEFTVVTLELETRRSGKGNNLMAKSTSNINQMQKRRRR